jgi:hypothetical protein
MERAETGDNLWNAAQLQLTHTGVGERGRAIRRFCAAVVTGIRLPVAKKFLHFFGIKRRNRSGVGHDPGKMHGFLRMYWAKKILEWTGADNSGAGPEPGMDAGLSPPEQALATAIYLNDKYHLRSLSMATDILD